MTSLQEFRCEICGTITSNPLHWFVIQCRDSELTVLKWNLETANAAGARHFCGEAHAEVYKPVVRLGMFAAETGLYQVGVGKVMGRLIERIRTLRSTGWRRNTKCY
jgi:hypothetical protein